MFAERRAATLVKRGSFVGGRYLSYVRYVPSGGEMVSEIANQVSHRANSVHDGIPHNFVLKCRDVFWSRPCGTSNILTSKFRRSRVVKYPYKFVSSNILQRSKFFNVLQMFNFYILKISSARIVKYWVFQISEHLISKFRRFRVFILSNILERSKFPNVLNI